MPYIPLASRQALNLMERDAESPGELNYQLSLLVDDYVRSHGLSYQTINDVVGALVGVTAEFQRRIVGPYEDIKRRANSEVFTESIERLTQALNDELRVGQGSVSVASQRRAP